jgi:CubicO group peptidase (beta-lactamase class C family)
MRAGRLTVMALVGLCGAVAAPSAHAARSCDEPGRAWQRATPAQAGMDAERLQSALDYGTTQLSYAIRVYRRGCLVGEDRAAGRNRNERYESYSMAKSVTALAFGRAMRLRLISPDDPVGSLLPEADRGHGAVTMRDLLTMTSGVEWNGFRDYNVFTMPDRVRDFLTLRMVHRPGTYFEYAQSAVAALAEAIGRAAGEDVQKFAQRELMDPLGIPRGAWSWQRDPAGHVQGFYGVAMRPDDYGRLGELMRRRGVWRGRRLLSSRFMHRAIEPSRTNGCYGWLIWVNAGKPCIGPRIGERSIERQRDFPELPADLYTFSGLFGQRVAVFPSQAIVLVRTGQDRDLLPPAAGWERELYLRVLGAVTDQRIRRPGDAPKSPAADEREADHGFQNALLEPDRYQQGVEQDPLPPAGPERARAPLLELARPRASRRGEVVVRLWCPLRSPGRGARRCSGRARMSGGRRRRLFSVGAGGRRLLRIRLTRRRLRVLRRRGALTLRVAARNLDAAEGALTRIQLRVRRPRRR